MSVIDSLGLSAVGLKAAEQVERTLGPAMGLRSYRALLTRDDAGVRLAAVRGALRCMFALEDFAGMEELAEAWQRSAGTTEEVAAHCRALLRRGRRAAARLLAEAEVTRSGSARAWYLAARVREALQDEGAVEAFRRAVAEADPRGGDQVARAAQAALLERALQVGARGGKAEAELEAVLRSSRDLALQEGSDAQRILAAVVALRSTSKFRRASGLSRLAELADGPCGRQAVALAAEHADAMGVSLSWVEAERVEAVLRGATWLEEARRDQAVRRLHARRRLASADDPEAALKAALEGEVGGARHHDLARSVASGEAIDPDELALAAGVPAPAAHGLVAVDAMRRGDDATAARALMALRDDPGRPPVAGAWVAARLALGVSSQRDRGLALVERLMAITTTTGRGEGPPRGWSSLVDALQRVGADGLAEQVIERACASGDEDARDELVERLVRRAWGAWERAARDEATALLQRAKRLAAPRR